MPERWRACLRGDGEIDLSAVRVQAEHYALFAGDSLGDRLTGLLASKALQGDVRRLSSEHRPAVFEGFNGEVWQTGDLVVDVAGVCKTLARFPGVRVCRGEVELESAVNGWRLRSSNTLIEADTIVAAAGLGNEQLIDQAGIDDVPTQRRPLCQLVVRRADAPLPTLNGHCLTGVRSNEPRLTITTHGDGKSRTWYIGGRLATRGAELSDAAFFNLARAELSACLPWLDLRSATLSALRIDRAEPAQQPGLRPDDAVVIQRRNLLLCWASKLTLAPSLGDQAVAAVRDLTPPNGHRANLEADAASLGSQPW